MYQATYKVIQSSPHDIPTEVVINGAKVKATVQSLVVQLEPVANAANNSVIKLVLPAVSAQAPFVVGAELVVTFALKEGE